MFHACQMTTCFLTSFLVKENQLPDNPNVGSYTSPSVAELERNTWAGQSMPYSIIFFQNWVLMMCCIREKLKKREGERELKKHVVSQENRTSDLKLQTSFRKVKQMP